MNTAKTATSKITPAEMERRTARFADMMPSAEPFLDTRIPEYAREAFNVIGHGVTEDPDLAPAITAADGFNVTYIRAEPGKGAAAHDHATAEVFIPLTGRWTIIWSPVGDDGSLHETELGPMDVISVPAGVMRGFRNCGDDTALLLVILEGTDSGTVTWDPQVVEEARKTGLALNEAGELIEVAQG
ncbi:MAG: cupin domain-containing protein [Alphaproteobacteria bacterium]|nr:cupin domain-containing protein [Alphaproteobacteria bacterium]